MIRKLIILIIACISAVYSNGQENASCKCDSLYGEITEPRLIGDLFLNREKGSVIQYFIYDWLDGNVFLSNNMTVKNKLLRYNGYFDRLIWLTRNFQQVKLDKESVDGFSLNDKVTGKSYSFGKIKIKEALSTDSAIVYAQLLYLNNLSLYAYRKVILTGIEEDKGNHTITDEFEKRTFYYFKSGNNTLKGFRHINKKNILKIFPDRKEQIANLLRTEKQRRYKTEEDLIRVTELLNKMNWPGHN